MMYPQCLRVRQMVLQAYADVGGPQVRYNDTYTQCVYSTAVDQTTKTNAELCQVAVLSVQKRLCDAVRYTIAHYAASYAPVDAKAKKRIAVSGIPSHSYGTSLAKWDHTVLPATRHK